MTDRPMSRPAHLDDLGLEAALRDLASAIDWPAAAPAGAPDLARRVRVRLGDQPARTRRFGWPALPWRRALLLALAAVLALAAIAGAVGLGLPGLRLILGEPPATPPPSVEPARTPTPGRLGSTLGLGEPVELDDVETLTGLPLPLPSDPAIGPPDAVYVDRFRGRQVAAVWADSDALPETREPGIGLILMRFDGTVDEGFRQKIIGNGVTIETVSVGGARGFWISGQAHFFFYRDGNGNIVDDGRRWVDDALVWSDGGTTYRIEGGLGRDATIALAESME